jgi:hypothetical protein
MEHRSFQNRALSDSESTATAAGLGVTVRTPLGLPSPLTVLGKSSGLPKLPQIALSLSDAGDFFDSIGHKRTFRDVRSMSADIRQRSDLMSFKRSRRRRNSACGSDSPNSLSRDNLWATGAPVSVQRR